MTKKLFISKRFGSINLKSQSDQLAAKAIVSQIKGANSGKLRLEALRNAGLINKK